PGARVVRDAGLGPLFERCDERVLRKVFGQPDIGNDTGQAGDQSGGFDPPDCVDRLLGGRGHYCLVADSSRARSSAAASSAGKESAKSSASRIFRSSTTLPRTGERLTHSTASSMEATSQIA